MPKSCVVGGATEALRKVSAFKPSQRTLLNEENGPTMWDNGDQTGLDPLTTQWSAVCTSPETALSHLLFSERLLELVLRTKVSLLDPVSRLYAVGTAIQPLLPALSCSHDQII